MTDRSDFDRALAASRYLVLGTADPDGHPWVSPVFFARLGDDAVGWVSGPDARHSRHIAARPEVAVTVFDSSVEVGGAEAAYADAVARALPPGEDDAVLAALNDRLPDGRRLERDDLAPGGPLVAYRAELRRRFVLVRGGNPELGNQIDTTVEV